MLAALAPMCALPALAIADRRTPRRVAWWLRGPAVVCMAQVVAIAARQTPLSNRSVAPALAARMETGDRVAMVDACFCDLPFGAPLDAPLTVAGWDDPQPPLRDNWRTELSDAAGFGPGRERALLRPLDGLGRLGCGVGNVSFAAAPAHPPRPAGLTGDPHVLSGLRIERWRAAARACR